MFNLRQQMPRIGNTGVPSLTLTGAPQVLDFVTYRRLSRVSYTLKGITPAPALGAGPGT